MFTSGWCCNFKSRGNNEESPTGSPSAHRPGLFARDLENKLYLGENRTTPRDSEPQLGGGRGFSGAFHFTTTSCHTDSTALTSQTETRQSRLAFHDGRIIKRSSKD